MTKKDNTLEVPGVGTEDYSGWEMPRTRQGAIKDFCKQCMGESYSEVKHCSSKICSLKPFRTGENPFRVRRPEMSEDKKAEVAERFRVAREGK